MHTRMEIAVIFEMNIDFSCLKRYNRYIPKTEGGRRPCQDRHGAVGFVTYHESINSAPTGTDTGADTIGERIGTAHQPGADTQEFLGGRTGGTEARCDHAAG